MKSNGSIALSANSLPSVHHLQLMSSAPSSSSEIASPPSSIAESPEPGIESSSQMLSQDEQTFSEAQPENPPPNFWKIFLSTFATIFLAELGDKTQVTTLLMSAQSQAPWIVFAGAGSALVATSLIGVLLGKWLSSRISPRTLDMASGVVLMLITVGLVWDVFNF